MRRFRFLHLHNRKSPCNWISTENLATVRRCSTSPLEVLAHLTVFPPSPHPLHRDVSLLSGVVVTRLTVSMCHECAGFVGTRAWFGTFDRGEHAFGVAVLVAAPHNREGAPSGCGHRIGIWQMSPFRGELPAKGVVPTAGEPRQPCPLLRLPEPVLRDVTRRAVVRSTKFRPSLLIKRSQKTL